MQNSLPTAKRKTNATEALVGLWTISMAAFVVAGLYFTREILIPIALAALLTFLLSPLVSRIERWVGRVAAVLVVAFLVFGFMGSAGWIFTRQLMDLAAKLPNYEQNIQHKLQALKLPNGGAFSKLSKTFNDLKKDLPGMKPPANESAVTETSGRPELASPESKPPMPVQIVSTTSDKPMEIAKAIIEPVVGPLGTMALIILLVICMLLQREDLRSRLIRLVGQGHISATTHAMDDAGARVSRYLFLQFVVNVCYGALVAACLYFVGIPNALLWGAFSAALRFIPYVGAWIAAAFPVILSLAISTNWTMPAQTIGLFVILELICANFVEPWLFGTHTGVSTIAIIVAAVFWTWLWGPVGLLLSTPLTVCVVVMGRHVPRMRFLSILLSDDEALTPSEECYHRLLAGNLNEMSTLVDAHMKEKSLADLYDNVMIGVVTAAESDYQTESLDEEGRATVEQSVREIVEDLSTRPAPAPAPTATADVATADQAPPPALAPAWRIYCLPARAERDELAGAMLAHLLHDQGFHAENGSAKLSAGELVTAVEKFDADAVCISVIAPSTVVHARYLATKLHRQFPALKIVVGLWAGAAEDGAEAAQRLKEAGANEVVTTLADAVAQLAKLAPLSEGEVISAPIPEDEEQRMEALRSLGLPGSHTGGAMDRVAKRVARIFDAPIAMVTVVDGEHQHFIGQTGLPEALADARKALRAESVCGHLVADNEVVVVEDLARDRRFAGNTFLKANGLRFYAGAPLRAPEGQPIGSLCIMDTKPRKMSERELRLLRLTAEDVMEEMTGGNRPDKARDGAETGVAAVGISG